MFLSAITPPIGNARWTTQNIRKFSDVWIFILQICSALLFQEINTSMPILLALWMYISWICNGKLVSSYWPKFAVLLLFVETMPIYKAVATGNRNNELYRETARSNWKYPSIVTMPDYSRITVFILTPPPFFVTIYTFIATSCSCTIFISILAVIFPTPPHPPHNTPTPRS